MQFKTQRWINYLFSARHRGGHGIHSPFLYRLITSVIENKGYYSAYPTLENAFKICRTQNACTREGDSLKFGKLLFRLANDFQPTLIHAYTDHSIFYPICLALADSRIPTKIFRFEQHSEQHARHLDFITDQLVIKNCSYFPTQTEEVPGLVFIDSNEEINKTEKIIISILKENSPPKLLIINNPHRNDENDKLWNRIKDSINVRITLDLFTIGLAILDPKLQKENFTLRY